MGMTSNMRIDAAVLSAGVSRLPAAGHLRRRRDMGACSAFMLSILSLKRAGLAREMP